MLSELLDCVKKNLGLPDIVREFSRGRMELVILGDTTVARLTLDPGWKWSESIRPIAKTTSCLMRHAQYVLSGQMIVAMDDGERMELRAGDFASIPPGHDAWVVGDEPFVALDFSPDMREYAADEEGCNFLD
jgi:hypothetical protein